MYARRFALLGVVAFAAAASVATARAGSVLPAFSSPIEPGPVLANGWWACPDTGSCSARTLHLWLPSFGSGNATVESGPVLGSCGEGCYVIPNGALITIRAHPSYGYTFTGWGGKCGTVTSTGCYFHMWNNYTAGATFEQLQSPNGNNSSESNGGPVTSILDFVVQVSGRGNVVVQGTGLDYPTSVCKPPYPCTLTRYQKWKVQVRAIATGGGRFLGWGGRQCARQGTQPVCEFKNDFDLSNSRPRITARFG